MKKILLVLLLFTVLTCFPFLLYPSVLVSRGNDLEEFFWPMIYFSKSQIIGSHSLPLWNPLFFSGMPLISDPQAPYFYIPNVIFLFFNLDPAFVISVFLHIFWASLGMYLLSKNIFRFSDKTNLFLSALYIFSPKLSAYIEAGHLGLIYSYAWLPWTLFLVVSLAKKPTIRKSIFLATCLSALFFTHILIFLISIIVLLLIYTYTTLKYKTSLKRNLIYILTTLVFNFCFMAIALLPQLEWSNQTTRFLLIANKDIYPKWLGFSEFIKSSTSPILYGYKYLWGLDTEKYTVIGIGVLVLSTIGFLTLKKSNKIITCLIISTVMLIVLNNISPINFFLLTQKWFSLIRVSTRFWFIVLFFILYLAGLGFEKIGKYRLFRYLAVIACIELLLTSWIIVMRPFNENHDLVSDQIYEFLVRDKDNFRVLCTTKCLSQKKLAMYNIQSTDGYGTLQQKNYYDYSQQLYQAFWRNRYTLAIPPYEIYNYEKLIPYPPSLTALNVKYVISPYEINRQKLTLIYKIDGYLIYKNNLYINPNYLIFSPNFIRVSINSKSVIIPEVYNSNWKTYSSNGERTSISQTTEGTINIETKSNSNYVDLIYYPKSYEIGKLITLFSLIFVCIYIIVIIGNAI